MILSTFELVVHERHDVSEKINTAQENGGRQVPATQHLPDGEDDGVVVAGGDVRPQVEDEIDVEGVGIAGQFLCEEGFVAEKRIEVGEVCDVWPEVYGGPHLQHPCQAVKLILSGIDLGVRWAR